MKQTNLHHSYLLGVTEKELNAVMYDMGMKYDRISVGVSTAHLVSERFDLDDKELSFEAFMFMVSAGLIDDVDHRLTDAGKAYFEIQFVHANIERANEYIKSLLIDNPVVNLIHQVFFGRGKISVEQLQVLLNYHQIAEHEIGYSETVSLLVFLNKFCLITYDKKNKGFTVNEYEIDEKPIKQYYISPSTPYSNILNLRKIMRSLYGNIYWIDKHFRKEGFEIIHDGLASEGVQSITIISTRENATASAKDDYVRLKQELAERSISLTWRTLDDKSFMWHDRWLLSEKICYNIPPMLSIIRGQRADVLQTQEPLDLTPFVDNSIALDSEF